MKLQIPIVVVPVESKDSKVPSPESSPKSLRVLSSVGLEKVYNGLKVATFLTHLLPTPQELATTIVPGSSCDILFSSTWPSTFPMPSSVLRPVSKKKGIAYPPPEDTSSLSSPIVSTLGLSLKPRYHFVSSKDLPNSHIEMAPFCCDPVNDNTRLSRLIVLGQVGNPCGSKWLYALDVTPGKHPDESSNLDIGKNIYYTEIAVKEINAPTERKKRHRDEHPNPSSNAGKKDSVSFKKARDDKVYRDKRKFTRDECWFCLASPHAEKHLVINVGEHCYIAVPKGGVTMDSILIVGIDHLLSLSTSPSPVFDEIMKCIDALKKMFATQNKSLLINERNVRAGSRFHHMFLQIVPIPNCKIQECVEAFKNETSTLGFEFQEIDTPSLMQENLPHDEAISYDYYELPDGSKWLHIRPQIEEKYPFAMCRKIACVALNTPDRVNWKSCILRKNHEVEVVGRLRASFGPFDFAT